MLGIFHFVWNTFLYAPLLNSLIWLYNGPADQNLGVAVIILTVILRLALLPLSVLSERNKHIYEKIEKKIEGIERAYKNDEEQQKEKIRELLREHNISPWSRAWLIIVQFIVLVVLYKVFMGGISQNNFDQLYSSITRPDLVFTNFLGWDLAERSWFWAALVGAWLFIDISMEQRKHHESLARSDIFYRLAFPAFSMGALLLLPMVKSLFILTSLVFSFIIASVRKLFFKVSELDDV